MLQDRTHQPPFRQSGRDDLGTTIKRRDNTNNYIYVISANNSNNTKFLPSKKLSAGLFS